MELPFTDDIAGVSSDRLNAVALALPRVAHAAARAAGCRGEAKADSKPLAPNLDICGAVVVASGPPEARLHRWDLKTLKKIPNERHRFVQMGLQKPVPPI